jgi:uracil-DNA glycosylase family 4
LVHFQGAETINEYKYAPSVQKNRAKLYLPHKPVNVAIGVRNHYEPCDVLFVGDIPSGQDDKANTPFSGGPGKLLRTVADKVFTGSGLKWRFTNLVRCAQPGNKLSGKVVIRACSPELVREIKARSPRLIVAVGAPALAFLAGGTSGVTWLTGLLMETDRVDVAPTPLIPLLHPGYVLANDHEHVRFCESMLRIRKFLDGRLKKKRGAGKYVVVDRVEDVEKLMAGFRRERRLTAYDTETATLLPHKLAPVDRTLAIAQEFEDEDGNSVKIVAQKTSKNTPPPDPAVLCLSLSNREGTAYVVPYDHPDSPFSAASDRRRVREAVAALLADAAVPKLAQNWKFDNQQCRKAFGVWTKNLSGDTLYIHTQLDEQRGTHGLKQLAVKYTGMAAYERPLERYIEAHPEANPRKGGSYRNIPGSLLFAYAGADADVTLRVRNRMWKKLTKRQRRLCTNFYPALLETLAKMEYTGATVDRKRVAQVEKEVRRNREAALAAVLADPAIREFIGAQMEANPKFEFNLNSAKQLRGLLFEHFKFVSYELTDRGEEVIRTRHRAAWTKAKRRGEPGPPIDELIKKSFHTRREYDLFSVSADVLHACRRNGKDVMGQIVAYKEATTLLTSFILPMQSKLDLKSRIHGHFYPDTVTGRLSSSDPNLTNIPSRDKGLVKSCYVSRWGRDGFILQSDYSQIELRVAAAFFNEPKMKEAYHDDKDLHLLTALDVLELTQEAWDKLDKATQKKNRTAMKRVNFGIIYRGTAIALVKTLKKDGIFITREEAEELITKYMQKREGLAKGIADFDRRIKRDARYEAPTGYVRRVPEVRASDTKLVNRALRQMTNFPIQHVAAWMTLFSLILIDRRLRKGGYRSRLILTVHDSIVLDVHKSELWPVARMVKDVMERITELTDEVVPGVDWSWMDVPIKAEMEVGYSWGVACGFDPTVSRYADELGDLLKSEDDGKGGRKMSVARTPTTLREVRKALAAMN